MSSCEIRSPCSLSQFSPSYKCELRSQWHVVLTCGSCSAVNNQYVFFKLSVVLPLYHSSFFPHPFTAILDLIPGFPSRIEGCFTISGYRDPFSRNPLEQLCFVSADIRRFSDDDDCCLSFFRFGRIDATTGGSSSWRGVFFFFSFAIVVVIILLLGGISPPHREMFNAGAA